MLNLKKSTGISGGSRRCQGEAKGVCGLCPHPQLGCRAHAEGLGAKPPEAGVLHSV